MITPTSERLREARSKVMNWTPDQIASYICDLELQVNGMELAAELRPDERAHAFAYRHGAFVGDNVWEFVLRWAEGAERAIKGIDIGARNR